MNHYPTLKELLAKEEQEIMTLKRSPRSMLDLFSWAIITFCFILVLIFFFPGAHLSADYFPLNWLSFSLLFVIPIGFAIESVRRYHDDLYIIEKKQVVHKGGRLSIQYSVPSVQIPDIRAVVVSQTFSGRLFDYGNVELNTAAHDQGELIIEGVRAPDELGLLMEDLRRQNISAD